jgi:hypothetical protein
MRFTTTERGFDLVLHEMYPPNGNECRLVQESSAIGDYEDSVSRPGTSFLWFGDHHQLNREEVEELASRLRHWLDYGTLKIDSD